jgi:hypothetical protein
LHFTDDMTEVPASRSRRIESNAVEGVSRHIGSSENFVDFIGKCVSEGNSRDFFINCPVKRLPRCVLVSRSEADQQSVRHCPASLIPDFLVGSNVRDPVETGEQG